MTECVVLMVLFGLDLVSTMEGTDGKPMVVRRNVQEAGDKTSSQPVI